MSEYTSGVRLPRLLDAQLHPARILHPAPLSTNEKLKGTSEATMRLAPDEEAPALRDFVRLYTQRGDAGVWRVSSVSRSPATGETAVTLLHGRDLFSDCVLLEQGDFSGTAAQLLAKVISAQTAFIGQTAFWTLGTVANVNVEPRSLNFDRCSSVLDSLENELTDYHFTYDMSGFPWVLGLEANGTVVNSEFRMSRNIDKVSITMNDADLCTRLIVSAHHEKTTPQQGGPEHPEDDEYYATTGGTQDIMRIFTYQSTSAIGNWGVVVKTADIDVTDNLAAGSQPGVIDVDTQQSSGYPATDAWARTFIAMRQRPTLQIQLSGRELCRRSGCTLDQITLGMLSRVNLVEYDDCWEERVVSINRPDVIGDPENVSVSMANTLPKFTESIARIRQQTESNTASSRSSRRYRSAMTKDLDHWQQVITRTWDAVDGTGLKQLQESGVEIDAQHTKIYSLIQGDVSMLSMIQTNASEINLRVQKNGVISAINQTAEQITINASKINIETTSGDTGLYIDNGTLKIKGMLTVDDLDARYISADSMFTELAEADEVVIGGECTIDNEGYIDCAGLYIDGDAYAIGDIQDVLDRNPVTDISLTAPSQGSNDYTLSWEFADGTSDSQTFSRAIASFSAVGGSGTITVTANPQNQSCALVHVIKPALVNGQMTDKCTSNIYKDSDASGNFLEGQTIFLYNNTASNTVEARIGTSAATGTAVATIPVSGGSSTILLEQPYLASASATSVSWRDITSSAASTDGSTLRTISVGSLDFAQCRITVNGNYAYYFKFATPPSGTIGRNVSVTSNGTHTATAFGYDYLESIDVQVPGGGGDPTFFIADATLINNQINWVNYSPISTSDLTSTYNINDLAGYKYLGVSGGSGIYKFVIPSGGGGGGGVVSNVVLASNTISGYSYTATTASPTYDSTHDTIEATGVANVTVDGVTTAHYVTIHMYAGSKTGGGGGGSHNISISGTRYRDTLANLAASFNVEQSKLTQIFSSESFFLDGCYGFKVTCGNSEKYYYFRK